jgi:molybdate transport system substrate-binding protein
MSPKIWNAVLASVLMVGSVVASGGVVNSAEIRCLCPVAMKAVLGDATPQFERSSGHKVTIEYATAGVIVDRILKGDPADITMISGQQNDNLQERGKIVVGSRVDIARVGVGVFVRAGATKPDISSVDAIKRMLLAAKSVSYSNPAGGGVSGIHAARVIESLGIAAELQPKTQLLINSQVALEVVAKGDAEIGFGLTSDTATSPGVDLVGPLPTDIQNFTLYAAGIVAGSKVPDAAKAMIDFLSSPAGQAVLKAKGFEPR